MTKEQAKAEIKIWCDILRSEYCNPIARKIFLFFMRYWARSWFIKRIYPIFWHINKLFVPRRTGLLCCLLKYAFCYDGKIVMVWNLNGELIWKEGDGYEESN